MDDSIRFRALVLDLLAQILIKVHAGEVWGASESEVLKLTADATNYAEKLRRLSGRV